MEDEKETSYLRQRRKKPSMSLSCCFPGHSSRVDSSDVSSSSSPMISPSTWFRRKGHHDSPEVKGKSRKFMSRIGGRHARCRSADFSYDPLSYALNFDEGLSSDDTHLDYFAARMPVSPPRQRPSLSSRIKDLELRSPRKSAVAPLRKSTEISSAVTTAVEGRKSGESPAAAGGRSTAERPQPVAAREISLE